MSKEKYPNLFSKPSEGYHRIFPRLSCRVFGHVMRLDQSRARKNISWILNNSCFLWSEFFELCSKTYAALSTNAKQKQTQSRPVVTSDSD